MPEIAGSRRQAAPISLSVRSHAHRPAMDSSLGCTGSYCTGAIVVSNGRPRSNPFGKLFMVSHSPIRTPVRRWDGGELPGRQTEDRTGRSRQAPPSTPLAVWTLWVPILELWLDRGD